MRHLRCLTLILRLFVLTSLVGLGAASSALARNGLLGLFFDENASECTGDVGPGATKTLYVVLVPDGDTRGGITGAEFRVDIDDATSYVFQGEEIVVPGAIKVGDALGSGITLAWPECQSNLVIPILSFQVLNFGSGASGANVRIDHHGSPSHREFVCPLAVLCNGPVFDKVCVESGKAVLNPSQPSPCGPTTESAEWSRVKELYR
ncbi:MAG: hypothetical protein ACE5G2_02085 [Candidatus Krumholzibacteriia bacterium]